MREIRIHEDGERLEFSMWIDGEKVSFKELDDKEQDKFILMIHVFSQYFAGIEEISKVLLFNPN